MQLEHMTWYEVEAQLEKGAAVMLPTGSTEQHGPIGRIGTDTICATEIAHQAAKRCGAIVAPALAYTPAPFNTAFPGTVSVSQKVFTRYAQEVINGLLDQGFIGVFVVNGHGANIEPLNSIRTECPADTVEIRSWWDPPAVDALRKALFGDWEGMHATPSEVAITQSLHGVLSSRDAAAPPAKLSAEYIRKHSGDRHGPPDEHRAMFPDGRVGSHSALATPDAGARLIETAAQAIGDEFTAFTERLG